MDGVKEILKLTEKVGCLELKVERQKSEVKDHVTREIEKSNRKMEASIAQMLQLKIAESVAVAIASVLEKTSKTLENERKENDKRYSAKWVENTLKWLLIAIGGALISWFSGIIKFIVELFYNSPRQ